MNAEEALTASGDEDIVYAYDLKSSAATAEQRSQLLRQTHAAAQQQETEPLNPVLQAVKDGQQLQPGKVIQLARGQEGMCVSIAQDASMVAVGCHSGEVMLVAPDKPNILAQLPLASVPAAVVTALRFRPSTTAGGTNTTPSSLLLVAKGSHLLQVHTSLSSVVSDIDERDNKINGVVARQDGQMFATAGSDTIVRVYDDTRTTPILHLTSGDGNHSCGHTNSVFGMAWKPDEDQVLLSAGWDGTVQVWDLRTGSSVRSIAGGSWVCGDGLDVQGNKVLTGSWRNQHPLQLWDFGSGKLLTNLPFYQPHHEACLVYVAKFGQAGGAAEGMVVAGGSGSQPVTRLYHKKGHLLGTLHTQSAVHAIGWVCPKAQGVQAASNNTAGADIMAVCCARQLHLMSVTATGKGRT